MTGRLLQISGIVLDLVYRVRAVPRPGEEAVVTAFSTHAGGGFNPMVAARRQGMEVAWAGTLGTGPFADRIAGALAAEGIEVLRPRLPGRDQGVCSVLVDETGERTFVAAEGADGVVRAEDLAALDLRGHDAMLLSGYALAYAGSRTSIAAWLAALPRHAPPLTFDPAPLIAQLSPAARTAALAAAHWISANAAEARALTGQPPRAAAEALAKNRPGGAVVREGAHGCWIARHGQPAEHVPPHRVVAVDTNGAGDTHIGAFLAALARGEAPRDAARIANVAAALSTTAHGPATAPDLATTLAALTPETLSEGDAR